MPDLCETPWCVLDPAEHDSTYRAECADSVGRGRGYRPVEEQLSTVREAALDVVDRVLDAVIDSRAVDVVAVLVVAFGLVYLVAHLVSAALR